MLKQSVNYDVLPREYVEQQGELYVLQCKLWVQISLARAQNVGAALLQAACSNEVCTVDRF